MDTSAETQATALEYLGRGLSIIPVGQDKRPLLMAWAPYQTKRPSAEAVQKWWKDFPGANIGIVTGGVSGLLVVDCDTPDAIEKVEAYLPESFVTPIATTPRGRHYYFQHAEGFPNRANVFPGCDIRTKGGYVVAPPGTNGEGGRYAWLPGLSIEEAHPATMPEALANTLKNGRAKTDASAPKATDVSFTEGRRDDSLFSVANALVRGGMAAENVHAAISQLAAACTPPFPAHEAAVKVRSALKRANGREDSTRENKFSKCLISGSDLDSHFLNQLSMAWRIKGILPETSLLNEIYGLPGTYKSFIALDMALSIATGTPWHGREVRPCRVAYVAAEGQAGTLKRIKAWQKHHYISSVGQFDLFPRACLLDVPEELEQFVAATEKRPPAMVFVDTLARCMSGDENSTSDMGRMVIACGKLSESTGAQVVLVHHTGKDTTRGPRGAIALTGATDCLFEVKKTDDRLASLRCERQKDDEPFQDMAFRLEVQTTGFVNAEGEDMASLVPVYDPDAETAPRAQVKGSRKVALDALRRTYMEQGRPVHVDDWRAAAYSSGISASADQGAKQKAFARAVATLRDAQLIGCKDDRYWPCA